MDITIETYKGFEIFYDDESDKFHCDIAVGNTEVKEIKRASLKAVRQSINDYIKLNISFKPRLVLCGVYGGIATKYMSGIRADKSIVIQDSKDARYKSFVKGNSLDSYYEYNQDLLDEITQAKNELNLSNKKYANAIQTIKEKLVPIDFSKIII